MEETLNELLDKEAEELTEQHATSVIKRVRAIAAGITAASSAPSPGR